MNWEKHKVWPLLLGAIATYFIYYYFEISLAQMPFWDERIYVNAARAYLNSQKPFPNPEHPPLGKEILALGILLWGDGPQGWRFFSALSGAICGTLIILFVRKLTGKTWVALFTGALIGLDPLLFVHFRLGMLDPPLLAFLMLATYCAFRFWESPKPKVILLYTSGIFIGFALATKLLALVLAPIPMILILWRCRKEKLSAQLVLHLLLSFLLVPTLIFWASYTALGYRPSETWNLLVFNFDFHRNFSGAQAWSSRWYEWLYGGQPNWYFWKQISQDSFQGILGTGNLTLWIVAELLALYALITNRRLPEIWVFGALVLVQFALYFFKPTTFLQYMVLILPFLYILMGIGIGTLVDRYGAKHLRIIQIDLAVFFIGALLVFANYWPYLRGVPMARSAFEAVGAKSLPLPPP